MASRSLKACTVGIEQAEIELIKKKWSQEDLAREVYLDRQTIQKFFKGALLIIAMILVLRGARRAPLKTKIIAGLSNANSLRELELTGKILLPSARR